MVVRGGLERFGLGEQGMGQEENWFRTKEEVAAVDRRDAMSVRVANSAYDVTAKREEAGSSDEEDSAGNRWFSRGREGGAPFARLDGDRANARPRAEGARDDGGAVLCCCGPRWGGRKPASEGDGVPRTKGRWEVNDDDEYFKPPVWRQVIQKVKAQLNATSTARGEWVNYDPQSYEKNFDNGSWRDTSRPSQYYDENEEKLGLKERALHTALLQKFASSRSQKFADGEVQLIVTSPALSPLPVRTAPKSKDEFVPIWQRRASSPITLDVRQRVT